MRSGNALNSGVPPPEHRSNASLVWQKDRECHWSPRLR